MHQTIRTTLLLSATALFATACTNMPVEGQNSSYNTGYNTAPQTTNNVPEAGPLSATTPATTYTAPVAPVATAANLPAATPPQNIPVATVPQVPTANTTAAVSNNNNAYSAYAATATNTAVDYSQPPANANNNYTNYAAVNTNTTPNTAAVTNYYPDNSSYDNSSSSNSYDNSSNSNSYDTYANGNNNAATNYSNAGAASGGSAVQVFATGSQAKAERISQDMRSQGLPAIVDRVGGLYKVRVPYSDEGTARANLIRVRQASGEAGAFVTTR
uniref:SPOR domain-containing protein n=1 Tax=uncultured Thiotrichaceae bacterium TaxID=298394 RepID=A0A6S6S4R0_9GAMM|nr:MAG: Unknown protein [uncultured Thiotrichaceae bacterium]